MWLNGIFYMMNFLDFLLSYKKRADPRKDRPLKIDRIRCGQRINIPLRRLRLLFRLYESVRLVLWARRTPCRLQSYPFGRM